MCPAGTCTLLANGVPRVPMVRYNIFGKAGHTRFISHERFRNSVRRRVRTTCRCILRGVGVKVAVVKVCERSMCRLPASDVHRLVTGTITRHDCLRPKGVRMTLFSSELRMASPKVLLGGIAVSGVVRNCSGPEGPTVTETFTCVGVVRG